MVGVSDDVSEYAMALRDTEDKLRRCPKRVRPGQADRSGDIRCCTGAVFLLGVLRVLHKGNLVLGLP
jgi:hypothetical protein